MPKVSIPSGNVAVTRSEIESMIRKIEYILQGRFDADNIMHTNGGYAKVDSQLVHDMANSTRPIAGRKIFGHHYTDGSDSVFDTVLSPYLTAMKDNHIFITASTTKAFTFKNDGHGGVNPIQHDVTIEIELADNIVPVSEQLFLDVASDNYDDDFSVFFQSEAEGYVIRTNASYSIDMTKDDRFYGVAATLQSVDFTNQRLTLSYHFNFNSLKLEDNEYFAIELNPTVLCEVIL